MIGQEIGHFKIVDKIGEGGMGVVWKARDLNLGRMVALKMLPVDRAGDEERRHRLLQEARAASALNHPHIVTIYEIVREQDQDLIAMEYVEGRTLDGLIPRQGFRLNEALKIAIQVADALAEAHRSGFVHRDLKPSNVMLTHDGRVKVLDFGLAKLARAPRRDTEATATLETGEGTVVGTPAYMSPEQAEGWKVDSRSDVFAFGALLYELLTGERAFQGDSRASTLAAVIRDQPKPLAELAPGLPREVTRIVERCLRKDPERRIQHLVDAKLALEDLREESESGRLSSPSGASVAAGVPAGGRWRLGVVAAGAMLALVLAIWAGWRWAFPGTVNESVVAQAQVVTSYPGMESDPAISPDGKQLAFTWDGGALGGPRELYVKLVDAGSPLKLTDTPNDMEREPRWSPDGRFLAFYRRGENPGYFVIPALGGTERKVYELSAKMPQSMNAGLTWTADGKALIVVEAREAVCRLIQVDVQSGEMQVVTAPPPNVDGDESPAVSPDGRWLVYRRGMATDAKRWERVSLPADWKSPAEVLTETGPVSSQSWLAWMPDGRTLILTGGAGRQMMYRLDLETRRIQPLAGTESGMQPSMSRDGKLMFLRTVVDSNIWRLKVGGDGKLERLIASDRRDLNPDYSPDGKRIAFVSDRGGTQQLWVADTDGTNAVALTTDAVLPAAPRWSPDGKWVAFAARPKGNVDVYATPASGGAVKRLTQHPSEDASARYSRDGKWIYFASNRTGRREVWRKPADGTGDETQITRNGGWVSRESKDGQWLFYTKFGMGPGVFRIKLPAGEEQKVIEADPESAWALENDELYFADKGFDGYRKWNPATRIVSVAARMGFPALRGPTGLSVSPDGQWLLIWKVDANISEILMMEGVK